MKLLFVFFLLISTSSFAQEELFVDPEEPAEFPGGYVEFRKFFKEHFVYPQDAIDKELSGKCYVQFVVDKEGVCKDFIIKRPVPNCVSCDEEALRLLKLMPKWKPALLNGEPIESLFTVPVIFHLD